MIVYRFMTKTEFLLWLEDNKNFGTCYQKCAENSHNYKTGEKYLHFFKNLDDAQSVLSILSLSANHLCKFDIDEKLLEQFEGKGKYFADGMTENGAVEVVEYAIPVKYLSKENLVGYTVVKDKNQIKFLSDKTDWHNEFLEEESLAK